jgi:hypothetical protein
MGYATGFTIWATPWRKDVNGMLFRPCVFVNKCKPDRVPAGCVKHVPPNFFGKMDDPKDLATGDMATDSGSNQHHPRFSDWTIIGKPYSTTFRRPDMPCFSASTWVIACPVPYSCRILCQR